MGLKWPLFRGATGLKHTLASGVGVLTPKSDYIPPPPPPPPHTHTLPGYLSMVLHSYCYIPEVVNTFDYTLICYVNHVSVSFMGTTNNSRCAILGIVRATNEPSSLCVISTIFSTFLLSIGMCVCIL